MAEEKKKTAAKAPAKKPATAKKPTAAAKKPVAAKKSAPAPKAAAKAAPAKKAKDPNAKKIRVTRTGSLIGATKGQKNSMQGLGLRKIGVTRELNDTLAIRGMIRIVAHLVRVEG